MRVQKQPAANVRGARTVLVIIDPLFAGTVGKGAKHHLAKLIGVSNILSLIGVGFYGFRIPGIKSIGTAYTGSRINVGECSGSVAGTPRRAAGPLDRFLGDPAVGVILEN